VGHAVVVGDKVFTRSEPYDLICLDKLTGKILWVRSHRRYRLPPRKEGQRGVQEVEPLVAELRTSTTPSRPRGGARRSTRRSTTCEADR
jgi:hypothetical protein